MVTRIDINIICEDDIDDTVVSSVDIIGDHEDCSHVLAEVMHEQPYLACLMASALARYAYYRGDMSECALNDLLEDIDNMIRDTVEMYVNGRYT